MAYGQYVTGATRWMWRMTRHNTVTDLPSVLPEVVTFEQGATSQRTMDSSRKIYSVSTTTVSRPYQAAYIRFLRVGYGRSGVP